METCISSPLGRVPSQQISDVLRAHLNCLSCYSEKRERRADPCESSGYSNPGESTTWDAAARLLSCASRVEDDPVRSCRLRGVDTLHSSALRLVGRRGEACGPADALFLRGIQP